MIDRPENDNLSKIPVSVLVVTRNAAGMLRECLNALTDFAEVLVIDSNSTDGTKHIATECGVRIISYQWNGRYPKKRQWSLDTLDLAHKWVFFVDADEVLTSNLVNEIRILFLKEPASNAAGYFINGQYVWNGKTLNFGLRSRKIALLHRQRMRFPEVDDLDCPGMGEIEGHYQPVPASPEYKISRLQSPLLHYGNRSPKEWQKRHEGYAAWESCMIKKHAWPQDPVAWRNVLKQLFRALPGRGPIAFLHSYVLKLGLLDGSAGYDFAKSRWRYYRMIKKI